MNLDAEFKKELVEFAKTLENSKYLEGFAQSMADDHAKYGEEPDDMIGDFDAIREDCRNICTDYINTIVHDNPDGVWDALCEELERSNMLAYIRDDYSKRVVKKYYDKPYDNALDNNEESILSYICECLLTRVYMYEQGGWLDQIIDVYEGVILRMYDKIVAE